MGAPPGSLEPLQPITCKRVGSPSSPSAALKERLLREVGGGATLASLQTAISFLEHSFLDC